jgi:hypothetical protein
MKLFKVDNKGKPISVPEEVNKIIRDLGVSAPPDMALRQEYLESIGYIVSEPTEIPTPPPELNGKCKVELDIPVKNADGSYTRAYKFTELTEAVLVNIAAANRTKRDKILTDLVDSINAIRWNSMSSEKQNEWKEFRISLLDITSQPGWPANLVWPKIPV